MYHHHFTESFRDKFNELVNAFLTIRFWKVFINYVHRNYVVFSWAQWNSDST